MDNLVRIYTDVLEAIYEAFGYEEKWVTIPIEDRREYYWTLYENKDGSGDVRYSHWVCPEPDDLYSDVIFKQESLPQCVYRGDTHTMICVDTKVDGNKYLAIYDNEKEFTHD